MTSVIPSPLVISDLSICTPAERLSRSGYRGVWRLIDYETEEGIIGTMASAYPGEGAGELSLPIDVRGTFRVYIGINYSRVPGGDLLHHSPWPVYGQTQLKFEDDPGFTRFALEAGWAVDSGWKFKTGPEHEVSRSQIGSSMQIYTSIQETFWRVREFAGPTSLIISEMPEPYTSVAGSRLANLAYVKLVPVEPEEQHRWDVLQPTEGTRNLAIQWCTGMLSGHALGSPTYHPTSEEWFRDEIAPFVATDVGVLVVECIRGNLTTYRSQIGDFDPPENVWDPTWVDPLAAFLRVGHEHGLKVFASMRMMGRGLPMVDAPIGRASFVVDHPEFARRDRDGTLTNNVSLVFPEVREHWLSLLREVLNYGVDGVVVYFHRGQPFVLFEQPVIDDFLAKYGENPRDLSMRDPRLMEHWAGYVTAFLRSIRKLVDEKPGRQLGVSVYGVPYKFDSVEDFDPIQYNCDVSTWLDEGLIDYLMPTPSIDPALLRRWRERAGDGLHIWPDLQPRLMPAESSIPLARSMYEAGADGLSLWDGERRPPHASHWAVMRHLGHRDDLHLLAQETGELHRRVPLRKLSGYSTAFSFKDG